MLLKYKPGYRKGRLTVIENLRVEGINFVVCRCDCGKIETTRSYNFKKKPGRCASCRYDRSGQIIGYTQLIKRLDTENKDQYATYLCQCLLCGKETTHKTSVLKPNSFVGCRCRQKLQNPRTKYAEYKRSAGSREIEFDLSYDSFVLVCSGQCYYCGLEPIEKGCDHMSNQENRPLLGIDRIDSTLGYVEGNCVACCKFCNKLKNTYSAEVFIRQCKTISNHLGDV